MTQPTTTTTALPGERAVLVTGCSSGIGHATALYLSQQGYTVFATVRKAADADALRAVNTPTLAIHLSTNWRAAALEYLPQTWVDAIMERRG
jgi:NAD(P)-dependent dehydrogenase (short-subunit alcohol dehydrogenase family)